MSDITARAKEAHGALKSAVLADDDSEISLAVALPLGNLIELVPGLVAEVERLGELLDLIHEVADNYVLIEREQIEEILRQREVRNDR